MRLNSDIRKHICAKLLSNKFDAQQKQLAKDNYALAEAAYDVLYTKQEQRKLASLTDGWMIQRCHFYVYVLGQHIYLTLRKEKSFTYKHNSDSIYIHDDAFTKQWQKYVRDNELLNTQRYGAGQSIMSVLKSCSTTESLIKKWPECAKFVPKDEAKITTALAIPFKQLNQMLGLS